MGAGEPPNQNSSGELEAVYLSMERRSRPAGYVSRPSPFQPRAPLAARRLAQQSRLRVLSLPPSPSCREQTSLSSDQGEDTVHPLFLPFLVTPLTSYFLFLQSLSQKLKATSTVFTAHLPLAGDRGHQLCGQEPSQGPRGGAPESPSIPDPFSLWGRFNK